MQFDFTMAANGGQRIEAIGKFVKYSTGVGLIRVRMSGGAYVDLLPGQGIWGVDFSGLEVSDRSGAANSGVILAGNFDFRDERISGNVLVSDDSSYFTEQGASYIGTGNSNATAGANYNQVSLFNPAASGKNILVQKIIIAPQSGNYNGMWAQSAAVSPYVSAGLAATTKNKKVGGAASAGQIWQNSPGTLPALADRMCEYYSFGASIGPVHMLSESDDILLPPGAALIVGDTTAVATVKYVCFEWREVAL